MKFPGPELIETIERTMDGTEATRTGDSGAHGMYG